MATRDERVIELAPEVKALVRDAARKMPSYIDSRELVGPAWLGAIEAVDRFDGRPGARALANFAYQIIRGRIKDYQREVDPLVRSHRRAVKSGLEETPLAHLGREGSVEDRTFERIHCRELIARSNLNRRERAVVWMFYWGGMTQGEIAKAINLCESRVSQISQDAVYKIRGFVRTGARMPEETYTRENAVFTCRECGCATKLLIGPRHQPTCSLASLRTLSEREREIASMVGDGKTAKQIGEALGIAVKTVEAHRYNIYKRLGIHGLAALVRLVVAAENEQKAVPTVETPS